MGFADAIRTCFSKYATFSGRASYAEFWLFGLFYVAVAVVGGLIDAVAETRVILWLVWVVFLLPGLAVSVRRLHDVDRSGWWGLPLLAFVVSDQFAGPPPYRSALIFVSVTLVVPVIIVTVWCCRRGTLGPNRYGPDPLNSSIGTMEARSQPQPVIVSSSVPPDGAKYRSNHPAIDP